MIHTIEDFYNIALVDLRGKYFPNEDHKTTVNKNYWKTTQTVELFHNGCLTYRQLIGRLAKSCDERTVSIHLLISQYVISFGKYKYTPQKQ